jgi:hypothetical protein
LKKAILPIFCVVWALSYFGNAVACEPPRPLEKPKNIWVLYTLKQDNTPLNPQQEALLAEFEKDERRYGELNSNIMGPCPLYPEEMRGYSPPPPHLRLIMEKEMKAIARKWQTDVE